MIRACIALALALLSFAGAAQKKLPRIPGNIYIEIIKAALNPQPNARYCIRPAGTSRCDYRNGQSEEEAVRNIVKEDFTVVPMDRHGYFEVQTAEGEHLLTLEVVESGPSSAGAPQSSKRWARTDAWKQEQPEYEVSCGPGFVPSAYNNAPNNWNHWACSNGTGIGVACL